MIKKMEQADGQSCWNKAHEEEMVFVLLERDLAAPYAIREWAKKRIELGKNTTDDHQIKEALGAALFMERRDKSAELLPNEAKRHTWEYVHMSDGRRVKRCSLCWCAYEFGYDLPCTAKPKELLRENEPGC